MTNTHNIPAWLEEKVKNRDTQCVYCGATLKEYPHAKGTPSDKATFEHIDNDGPPTEENIAMCCGSCNASKLNKKLLNWFDSPYCKKNNICKETVAAIVRKYIETST